MNPVIAVLGAGPGLGRAMARRYAADGYDAVLVGRRTELLEDLAAELRSTGGTAYVVPADLVDTDAVPGLAERIRSVAGDPDALYYAPTPDGSFVAATDLTPERVRSSMPVVVYSLVAVVREFLPHMLQQGSGAILSALGASAIEGMPHMSGHGPGQAAQRNYLQSLHGEVAERGVSVGLLSVGAVIAGSAYDTMTQSDGTGGGDWGPAVEPDLLADLLRDLHHDTERFELRYPA